jgi:hypothetical protein
MSLQSHIRQGSGRGAGSVSPGAQNPDCPRRQAGSPSEKYPPGSHPAGLRERCGERLPWVTSRRAAKMCGESYYKISPQGHIPPGCGRGAGSVSPGSHHAGLRRCAGSPIEKYPSRVTSRRAAGDGRGVLLAIRIKNWQPLKHHRRLAHFLAETAQFQMKAIIARKLKKSRRAEKNCQYPNGSIGLITLFSRRKRIGCVSCVRLGTVQGGRPFRP